MAAKTEYWFKNDLNSETPVIYIFKLVQYFAFLCLLTASFLLEKGQEAKLETEAPQKQEEPLVPQNVSEAQPQMRHRL